MIPPDPTVLRLAVALGIGLLIGLERERRKGVGPDRAPAGIRTFALTSLLGGVSLLLPGQAVFVVAALFVAALTALGYARSRAADPGLTTEVALLVTFLLGGLAVRDPALASALAVTVTVLLASRGPLHRFVRNVLSEQELHDGLVFAAAAVVILPLAPDRALDPLGVFNPRTLWKLVILVMAISAAGYVAMRGLGPRAGLPLAGFASGFVSSAATIGAMGARARTAPATASAAVAGAVLSTVATVVQLTVLLAAIHPVLLSHLAPSLAMAGVAAVLYAVVIAWRTWGDARERAHRAGDSGSAADRDPRDHFGRAFSLRMALLFAVTVTAVVSLATAVTAWLGAGGLAFATGLAGFADAHAAAISAATMAIAGRAPVEGAALAVLVGLSTNTATKIVLATTAGGRGFAWRTVPGLLLVLACAWLGLWLDWMR